MKNQPPSVNWTPLTEQEAQQIAPYEKPKIDIAKPSKIPLPQPVFQRGLDFVCQIQGLPAQTFAITQFKHQEALSDLFTLTLTAASTQSDIDLDDLLMRQADFFVFENGRAKRKISGIISHAEVGKTGFRRTFYTLEVRPALWRLTLHKNSRLFQHKSVLEIAEILLNEHQISFDYKMFEAHHTHTFISQRRESDYDFLRRLFAQEGISFWHECDTESAAQLFFSDSRLGCTGGVALIYNTHPQSSTTADTIHQMELSARMVSQSVMSKDRNPQKPRYALLHTSHAQATSHETLTQFEGYGGFQFDKEGAPYTRYRLEQLHAERVQIRAESNAVQVVPGRLFQVSEHPNSAFNAAWQPVRVAHEGKMPQAMEEEADNSGAYLTNKIICIPSHVNWRPPFIAKPLADGIESADVVGPEGEEIFTNARGEVKVYFHWNRYNSPNEDASCWLRVMQGWSGNEYGMYAIPRIGQEVIVDYLNGDIDRPIIIGATYNGVNQPPLKLPEQKTCTTLRTRTHKGDGFNELRFDDAQNQEEIYLHAAKNMNALINHDMHVQVEHDQHVRVNHDRRTEIVQDEHVIIHQQRKTAIDGDDSLKIAGSQHQQIGQALVIESGQEIHFKSGGRIVLDAATEIALKVGGHFVTINPAGVKASLFSIGGSAPSAGRVPELKLPDGVAPKIDDRTFAPCEACAWLAQQEGAMSYPLTEVKP